MQIEERISAWLSGFDGSASTSLVGADMALVSVDSRYVSATRQGYLRFETLTIHPTPTGLWTNTRWTRTKAGRW